MAHITLGYLNPGLPQVITEPTYPMVRDVLEPALRDVADEYGIPYREHKSEHAFTLMETGSDILCRSGDDPTRLRGPNLAAAGIDEACYQSEEVFTTLQGRVRHPLAKHQRITLASTPNGFDWVYERFAEPSGKRRLANASLVQSKSSENSAITENNPNWIAGMEQSYDAELFRQEVLGEFVAIGKSSTYYAFSDRNLRRVEYNQLLPLILCCDFNRSPMSWAFVQCRGRGHDINVVAELSILGTSTEKACDEVLARFGDPIAAGGTVDYRCYGDATGHAKDTTGNFSDWEIIRDKLKTAPYVARVNPRRRDRYNAVNAKLCNAAGAAQLFVNPETCPTLVRDFQQVRYVPGSLEVDDSNPALTHMSDAVGYYIAYEHPIIAGERH